MTTESSKQPSIFPPIPRTVLSILAARAEDLTAASGGRLVGSVLTRDTHTDDHDHALSVRVPALRNATLLLLEVHQGPGHPPLRLNTHVPKGSFEPRGLDELDAALERILLSTEVTERLRVLLARTMV